MPSSGFGFRISDFSRHSSFGLRIPIGFRISDFGFLLHALGEPTAQRETDVFGLLLAAHHQDGAARPIDNFAADVAQHIGPERSA